MGAQKCFHQGKKSCCLRPAMCASGVSPGPRSKQGSKVGSQHRKGPTRKGDISNGYWFTNARLA